MHEVYVISGSGREKAGLIVYEYKNTQTWQSSFLKQAHKEGETHNTPYLVIVSRAFPKKKRKRCSSRTASSSSIPRGRSIWPG